MEQKIERYYRVKTPFGTVRYALEEGQQFHLLQGSLFGHWEFADLEVDRRSCEILSPCQPGKIICFGLNYRDHAREMQVEIPKEPVLFFKPRSSVIGHRMDVLWPNDLCSRLDYEGELAVVIGKPCCCVKEEEALDYVFGYTCANDITARDLQPLNGQWTVAKSFDTFCPLGPGLVRGISPENLEISTYVNGQKKQHSNTANLHITVAQAVAYVSQRMTLEPEDVILTGTPAGVGPMEAGDLVTVAIEHLGSLTNRVIKRFI